MQQEPALVVDVLILAKGLKPLNHVRINVPNFLLFSFFPGEAKRFIWK